MTMTPDPSWSPKQVIENWHATVWNEGRRDAIRALFRGRAEGLNPGDASERLDPAAFEAFWDLFAETLDDLHVDILDVIEQGPRGAVRYRAKATHAASRKPVSFEGMAFFEIEDGWIVDAWNTLDFLSIAIQVRDEMPGDAAVQLLRKGAFVD